MLWHAGIHIHFGVLMEPQSLENCAFFVHVIASGHKYNKIHEYPHTKVSMHARDQQRKEKTLHLLFTTSTTSFVKRFFIAKFCLGYL